MEEEGIGPEIVSEDIEGEDEWLDDEAGPSGIATEEKVNEEENKLEKDFFWKKWRFHFQHHNDPLPLVSQVSAAAVDFLFTMDEVLFQFNLMAKIRLTRFYVEETMSDEKIRDRTSLHAYSLLVRIAHLNFFPPGYLYLILKSNDRAQMEEQAMRIEKNVEPFLEYLKTDGIRIKKDAKGNKDRSRAGGKAYETMRTYGTVMVKRKAYEKMFPHLIPQKTAGDKRIDNLKRIPFWHKYATEFDPDDLTGAFDFDGSTVIATASSFVCSIFNRLFKGTTAFDSLAKLSSKMGTIFVLRKLKSGTLEGFPALERLTQYRLMPEGFAYLAIRKILVDSSQKDSLIDLLIPFLDAFKSFVNLMIKNPSMGKKGDFPESKVLLRLHNDLVEKFPSLFGEFILVEPSFLREIRKDAEQGKGNKEWEEWRKKNSLPKMNDDRYWMQWAKQVDKGDETRAGRVLKSHVYAQSLVVLRLLNERLFDGELFTMIRPILSGIGDRFTDERLADREKEDSYFLLQRLSSTQFMPVAYPYLIIRSSMDDSTLLPSLFMHLEPLVPLYKEWIILEKMRRSEEKLTEEKEKTYEELVEMLKEKGDKIICEYPSIFPSLLKVKRPPFIRNARCREQERIVKEKKMKMEKRKKTAKEKSDRRSLDDERRKEEEEEMEMDELIKEMEREEELRKEREEDNIERMLEQEVFEDYADNIQGVKIELESDSEEREGKRGVVPLLIPKQEVIDIEDEERMDEPPPDPTPLSIPSSINTANINGPTRRSPLLPSFIPPPPFNPIPPPVQSLPPPLCPELSNRPRPLIIPNQSTVIGNVMKALFPERSQSEMMAPPPTQPPQSNEHFFFRYTPGLTKEEKREQRKSFFLKRRKGEMTLAPVDSSPTCGRSEGNGSTSSNIIPSYQPSQQQTPVTVHKTETAQSSDEEGEEAGELQKIRDELKRLKEMEENLQRKLKEKEEEERRKREEEERKRKEEEERKRKEEEERKMIEEQKKAEEERRTKEREEAEKRRKVEETASTPLYGVDNVEKNICEGKKHLEIILREDNRSENEWMRNGGWGVTNVWKVNDKQRQWEKKHEKEMDNLKLGIRRHFKENGQKREDYDRKMRLYRALMDAIQPMLDMNGCTLVVTGSTNCNLSSRTSGLDLSIVSLSIPPSPPEYIHHISFPTVRMVVESRGGLVVDLTSSLLKLRLEYEQRSIPVNVRIGPSCVYFSRLLTLYDKVDTRVSALILCLKRWALAEFEEEGQMSSILLSTLLIHFLQSAISPPVIPCLHSLFPLRIICDATGSFDVVTPLSPLPNRANDESLSSLLFAFFLYYSSFEFEKYAISVVEGGLKLRKSLLCLTPIIAIEDPWDRSYPQVVSHSMTPSQLRSSMRCAAEKLFTSFSL